MQSPPKRSFWAKILEHGANWHWYRPVVAGLAFLDVFVLIVPTDMLMVSAVLLQPKKWIQAFLWVGTGSGLGALAFAYLVRWGGEPLLERWFPMILHSDGWAHTQAFMERHGQWALGLTALSPFPLPPAVALSAIAGMSMTRLFLSVWIARTAKYLVYAWVASHAPRLLRKLPGLKELAPPPPSGSSGSGPPSV